MRCPECGGEINENEVFCPSCGAEMFGVPAEPAETSEAAEDNGTENPKKKKRGGSKDKKGASKNGKSKKQKLILGVRIGIIAVMAVLLVILIFAAADSVRASKGRKIFDKIPLGRTIDIIESDTGAAFLEGKASEYSAVNYCISDYKYICESADGVNVDGVRLPEWAVLLDAGADGSVNEAELYNFSVLKHGWMGARTAGRIEPSTVEFGMTAKAAERALGLKPYSIKKESTGNTSVYVYRYNYEDPESGNTKVRNFFVEVSDVDGKVKSAYDDELDYLNLMLAVHGFGTAF